MKTLTVKLPDELDARLTDLAARQNESKSALVRAALEQSLGRAEDDMSASCLHLARDLAGCIEGPGDLSQNPEHLEGYGR